MNPINRLIPKRAGLVCTSTSCWFIVLLFLLLWLPSVGQDLDFTFKSITVKDGLPSSQVYNVVQDKHGLLWFATDNGICSYDGKSYRVIDVHNLLGTNQILHLYKQRNGEIWGATISGAVFVLS
jgi:ligand-binding sensor domain-containing protein